MSGFETIDQSEQELLDAELSIEREIIGRACQTAEEKQVWVEKNATAFRKIVQDSEIIDLIKKDRNKAIEEIEKRLKE